MGEASQAVVSFEEVQNSDVSLGEVLGETLGTTSSQSASDEMKRLNQQYPAAVVLPIYRALAKQTEQLASAGQVLEQAPTEASLETFWAAWLEAASAWARGQAVAFGPVHSLGHGVALDFPSDQVGIDVLLAEVPEAETAIDLDSVALLPSLQGFEAIAYLLYGDGEDRNVSDFSARERQYLRRLAVTARDVSSELLSVWQTGWNGYAAYDTLLATAGQPGNGTYMTVESGTEEIVRSAIIALDGVVGETIPHILEVPEQLSESSGEIVLQLLLSTVEGVQMAYVGSTVGSPVNPVERIGNEGDVETAGGIGQWVEAEEKGIDRQIRQKLEIALDGIEDVVTNPDDTEALIRAQTDLATVKAHLEQDMLPLVQIQAIAFQ